jgi:hypothetical protein
MSMIDLIEKLSALPWTDYTTLSPKDVSMTLANGYIDNYGRPVKKVKVPNYCDTTCLMSICRMGGKTKDQEVCFYYHRHSYAQGCRHCVNVVAHHCDNYKAQMDKSTTVDRLVPYSDEEIRRAWEDVIIRKRTNALTNIATPSAGIAH